MQSNKQMRGFKNVFVQKLIYHLQFEMCLNCIKVHGNSGFVKHKSAPILLGIIGRIEMRVTFKCTISDTLLVFFFRPKYKQRHK